jgi:hypothetical protein
VEALGEGGVQGGQGHRYIPVRPARSNIQSDLKGLCHKIVERISNKSLVAIHFCKNSIKEMVEHKIKI